MNRSIIARTPLEMEEIGLEIAPSLRDGILVSLVGPLGSGKTTLTKGIAKGLLITDLVVSPSFVLAKEYSGRFDLHHIDAYRIASIDEFVEVGLDVLLPPETGVSVVEWPERIPGLIEISDILVTIELLEDGAREVTVSEP